MAASEQNRGIGVLVEQWELSEQCDEGVPASGVFLYLVLIAFKTESESRVAERKTQAPSANQYRSATTNGPDW